MVIRILLVDDDPALLDITKLFLERDPQFSVETAPSGEDALGLLDTGSYDAIVSDYEMPGMNGLVLLSNIRERGMSLPFIIFTGRGREEVVIEALNLGADFYLQKGGDPTSQFAELRSKIIHAVEKKSAQLRAEHAYKEMEKAVQKLEEQNLLLEESEAKFRNLANTTSSGILLYQHDQWIYANPAAEKISGYTAGELCGKKIWDNVAPEFREGVQYKGRLLEQGKGTSEAYEFKIYRKNGDPVWVHVRGRSTEFQGCPTGLISVVDITERKQMEEELREKEEKYRTLLDFLSDIILLIDGEDRFTDVHSNNARLYAKPEDFLGKLFMEVLPSYIYEQYTIAANVLRKTGEPQRYEYPLEINGEPCWFEASLTLQEDGVGIIAVIRNITDRKEVEKALRENEAKYRTLVENIPVGLIQADSSGNITYVNDRLIQILGSPSQEETRKINLLTYPLLRESGISEEVQLAIAEKSSREGERMYLSKWGADSYLRYLMTPLMNDSGVTGIMGLVEDITPRRRAEDALRLANHKLGLLSQITRHDILNDVLAAKGYLELNGVDFPDCDTSYLRSVAEALARIEREAEFTRDYQELGISPPQWQEVRLIMEESIRQMNIPGSIRIQMDISSVEIYADRLLTLAVSNIIRNALVHGKGLTTITISDHELESGSLCIAIEDDGPGVAEKIKEEILLPTYNRRFGHGLFLVREILDLTRISIRETGTFGVGARFELEVPDGRWRHLPATHIV